MVITLMHYAILANYFWLLAEGVYLQVVLSFPMKVCAEEKYFPLFMAGGWGKLAFVVDQKLIPVFRKR